MTISLRLRDSIIAVAALFGMTATAQQPCPATPEKYRQFRFGDVRFAIEERCARNLTQNEQFFVAGIAEALSTNCKLPRDLDARTAAANFTRAVTLTLALQKSETIVTQSDSAVAFAAGGSMVENIRCNGPEAALLSSGIAYFLKRTPANLRFVSGCMEFYRGRYKEKECRCVADHLRAIMPDVDERYFNRLIIKESINRSPSIALPFMFSCGVGEY